MTQARDRGFYETMRTYHRRTLNPLLQEEGSAKP